MENSKLRLPFCPIGFLTALYPKSVAETAKKVQSGEISLQDGMDNFPAPNKPRPLYPPPYSMTPNPRGIRRPRLGRPPKRTALSWSEPSSAFLTAPTVYSEFDPFGVYSAPASHQTCSAPLASTFPPIDISLSAEEIGQLNRPMYEELSRLAAGDMSDRANIGHACQLILALAGQDKRSATYWMTILKTIRYSPRETQTMMRMLESLDDSVFGSWDPTVSMEDVRKLVEEMITIITPLPSPPTDPPTRQVEMPTISPIIPLPMYPVKVQPTTPETPKMWSTLNGQKMVLDPPDVALRKFLATQRCPHDATSPESTVISTTSNATSPSLSTASATSSTVVDADLYYSINALLDGLAHDHPSLKFASSATSSSLGGFKPIATSSVPIATSSSPGGLEPLATSLVPTATSSSFRGLEPLATPLVPTATSLSLGLLPPLATSSVPTATSPSPKAQSRLFHVENLPMTLQENLPDTSRLREYVTKSYAFGESNLAEHVVPKGFFTEQWLMKLTFPTHLEPKFVENQGFLPVLREVFEWAKREDEMEKTLIDVLNTWPSLRLQSHFRPFVESHQATCTKKQPETEGEKCAERRIIIIALNYLSELEPLKPTAKDVVTFILWNLHVYIPMLPKRVFQTLRQVLELNLPR